MEQQNKWFLIETVTGQSHAIGNYTATPLSQVIRVKYPFGGFVWQRPTAVAVQRDGQEEIIPIQDATRLGQIGAAAAAIGLATIIWLLTSKRTQKEAQFNEENEK